MATGAHEQHLSNEAVSAARIGRERLDAAQCEHERHARTARVAANALMGCSKDLKDIGHRLYDAAPQRDLERVAKAIDESIDVLAGTWLKSPIAMEAERENPKPF